MSLFARTDRLEGAIKVEIWVLQLLQEITSQSFYTMLVSILSHADYIRVKAWFNNIAGPASEPLPVQLATIQVDV